MVIVITALLFFVILALSAASKGDTSGIEAIIKFILYAALIVGILFILKFCPQILLIIILSIIAFCICSSVYNKYKHNQMKNEQENINLETNIQEELPANTKTTDFMSELNSITKSQQEIELELYNSVKSQASYEYRDIKRSILNKAERGEYTTIGNKKSITYYHNIKLMNFTKEEEINIAKPTGILGTQSIVGFRTMVIVDPKRKQEYDFFMANITELATDDGITIETVYRNNNTNEEYPIPTPMLRTYFIGYEPYLKCTIMY